MSNVKAMVAGVVACALAFGSAMGGEFDLQRAEFAKYYHEITGKDAPEGMVRFAIDPKVSKSGRDAYSIVSEKTGTTGVSPVGNGKTGTTGVSPVGNVNGQDARSPSGERARCPFSQCVTITGSNVRSVWYGLYDLLERRGGCHWFWDGDVVPKRDSIDLSNLDVHEEARFEYRGLRYFAHRGLTRFQAEHWGPEDWKKEIDWILKRRLNVFMLRIGQDDLFQRTFPDACAYPDPSKPLPGAGTGYNDRSLFWSLQFRGKLRDNLQKYGFERGLMVPEDYGTMTHWYAPTPLDYIENRKPPFYPGADKRPENNRVWDVRDDRWIDEYWKMTQKAVETYGKGAPEPRLLHTIGTGERILSKDKKENFKLKVLGLQRFMSRVERDYPDAKLLMPGWDFYFSWTPQEVKDFLQLLDPKKCIVWDYSADYRSVRGAKSNFTNWGVIGKFPYTYSIFLAYEKALDVRAAYPVIEKRQELVQNDPFCRGFIFWPESSHTDTLLLRYFTANAWSDKAIPHGEVLDEFCASRYGKNAEAMKAAWKAVLPASWLRDWTTTYADGILKGDLGDKNAARAPGKWYKPVADAEKVFGMLAEIEWKDEFIKRDTIDIARMVLDRIISLRRMNLNNDVAKWRTGTTGVSPVGGGRTGTTGVSPVEGRKLVARAENLAALCDVMADLLALHTDYSLWESYLRLDAVEKIQNPNFSKTLFENASCGYCRSHQYELARYWYAPHMRAVAKNLAKAVASGNKDAVLSPNAGEERLALKEKPLESLRPTLPRTEENFRKVLRKVEGLLDMSPKPLDLPRDEFAKYYWQITGKEAPDGIVKFVIDPKVSKSGKDAYRIVSGKTGTTGVSPVGCVTITGSNLRSVWYGLYDLLERRGGCHWFWDGDVVPKKESIDLSNLDVYEEAHFEYRAIRYFAHRGLTRFQAEHWGLDDWKKEIDWLLKRRLNTFMLRIGQDDVFQRAFPEVCPYPDASKPQPGMYKGYNDRTLFWSLQFRGQLRRDLHKYAFERGLMAPEDFGTMSHWYSPTPDSYLASKKPPFLPQSNSTHAEPHLRVWDIREGNWAEEYWKLTKTAIDAYDQGAPEPRLLHTIGLGERRCYKDRKSNFDLKVKTLNHFLDMAKRDYPDAKQLIAGWDFYNSWSNEEVREYIKTLDKDRVIIWDYEADHAKRGATARNFTNWDVIGKFPYTYSIFLAFEKALDTRANYEIIEERQKLIQDDPFCKGYIFWPESSHTDTLLLRYFTANAWSDKLIPHGDVLDEFCASRYGANAEAMKAAWKAALPASWLRDWGSNYAVALLGIGSATPDLSELIDRWKQPVEDAKKVFTLLQQVPWDDPFVRRDSIDIVRMVLDRMIALDVWEFGRDLGKWRTGTTGVSPVGDGKTGTTGVSPVGNVNGQDARSPSDILARINRIAALCDRMADLLALHTDYSLWESYQRLDAVEKIRNPAFEKTLFENASCSYCRSHQYELARHWYAPHAKAVAEKFAKAVAAGNRKAVITVNSEQERLALKAKPLASLRPTLLRTEENFRRVLRTLADAGLNRDDVRCNAEAPREAGGCQAASFAALDAGQGPDEFAHMRAEFAKYYKQITGKDAPEGIVNFAIDPKVSKSGRDAYSIVSRSTGTTGVPPVGSVNGQDARSPSGERARCPFSQCVTITGSNLRSVWYGLYDLLERRGGCHWFWDGDVVPKRDSIDLSNLDVYEEAHFEYRAIRYFAHRGLTRFQAEHWGPEDWKKEIDWILKRRLNTFMLRIGQDDLFQRTFPEVCDYPDPAKPLPGTGHSHDDRTLFWSLQYRGELRDNLQKYAFARGLMVPEDFGTMTHWYSRTPEDFLAKKNPEFIPLANKGANYHVPNSQVWNIRDDKWVDEYWKMTKTAVETYGQGAPKPQLLHTIGLGERMCYKDRKKNFDMKILALDKFLAKAHTDYPDAKVLLAGWDFYSTWKPEEVRALLPRLDPARDIIWDYEGDVTPLGHKNNFTNWGLVGKFPYTFSMFLAYENALDARANYPLIEARQKVAQNDPFCKGYILWPESSHTDTLGLRFFTANAWAAKPVPYGDVLDEFCASRYGASAELMKKAWKAALPASWLRGWGSNYGRYMVGHGFDAPPAPGTIKRWSGPVKEAEAVFGLLARAPWEDEFVRRDAIDIARMVLDRVIALRTMELCRDIAAWRTGTTGVSPVGDGKTGTTGVSPVGDVNGQDARSPSLLVAKAEKIVALNEKMADLLALDTDYSLWETHQRMDAIEKIRNPEFSKTLFENASCPYCRSHQYELARHWYTPHVRKMAARLAKAVAAGDRKATFSEGAEKGRLALKAKPLESLKPTLPRTAENFRKVLREVEELEN